MHVYANPTHKLKKRQGTERNENNWAIYLCQNRKHGSDDYDKEDEKKEED